MQIVKLNEIANVFNGKTPSKSEQRVTGSPVLKIKDITEDGRFKGKFSSFIDSEMADKFQNKKISYGDTLILNAAHNSDYVGTKSCFATKEICGVLPTGEWLLVRPDGNIVDPKYIHYFLTSSKGRFYIRYLVKGIHLYPKDVSRIQIPLPPLLIQKKIAEVLDKADELRQIKKKTIEKLDELIKSIFLDMFGDPVTNPKGWDSSKISFLCNSPKDIKCGPFGTQLNKREYRSSGIPLWGIPEVNRHFVNMPKMYISPSKANELSQYDIQSHDIVMTRKGTVGNCSVYPENYPIGIMHSDLLRVRLDSQIANPSFISYQLHVSPAVKFQIDKVSSGAIMAGINVGKLKNLKLLTPPLVLQNTFEKNIREINKMKIEYKKSYSKLDNLFNSLMQRAFRGELQFKD